MYQRSSDQLEKKMAAAHAQQIVSSFRLTFWDAMLAETYPTLEIFERAGSEEKACT
jgi:hypothetical protein